MGIFDRIRPTVNPFEETAIAGNVSLEPHQRVQQERDMRIDDVRNMIGAGEWRDTFQGREDLGAATRYVDYKYPPVFGELTPGESGHPFEGGYGSEHWNRRPPFSPNPLRMGIDALLHKLGPSTRDLIGFKQPDWIDEYINRDVPEIDDEMSMLGLPGTEVAQSKWKEKFQSIIDMIMSRENLGERDAKRYIFDNYGLAV
jgi:hypothetical protein